MFPTNKLSTRQHIAATVVALVGLAVANTIINALYTASKFPVPFAKGQTSFSGSQVKKWYASMSAEGTLDLYVGTQLFDFVFMAAMASLGLLAGSLIVRLASGDGVLHKAARGLGRFTRVALPVGAGFDVFENIFSFVLLSRPETFSNFWAVLQSSAAIAKFSLQVPGIIAIVLSLILLTLTTLVNLGKPKPGDLSH